MKNKAVTALVSIVTTVILCFICVGCRNVSMTGRTIVMENESLSAFHAKLQIDYKGNINRIPPCETFFSPFAPKQFSIDFLGDRYTGDYQASENTAGITIHIYRGEGVSFWINADFKPISIVIDNKTTAVSENQLDDLRQNEDLLLSANTIFEQYCDKNGEICSDPVVEIHDYNRGGLILREYVVQYHFANELIKTYPAFSITFSATGEVVSSSLCAPLGTAQQTFVKKNLSYNDQTIKQEIISQLQPLIEEIDERYDREFVSVSVEDGVIDFVYLDGVAHVGVYSKVMLEYIQEYPEDLVEAGWIDNKDIEESIFLEFVTILD